MKTYLYVVMACFIIADLGVMYAISYKDKTPTERVASVLYIIFYSVMAYEAYYFATLTK